MLVGIAGGSGSGKSTIVNYLQQASGGVVGALQVDNYYVDHRVRQPEPDQALNFDCLEAFDLPLLVQHLSQLRQGIPVEVPQYEFSDHTRLEATRTLVPSRLILVDGLIVLAVPEIRAQLDLGIFVLLDATKRLANRIRRDSGQTKDTRQRTPESVKQQWQTNVQPFDEQVVQPSAAHADLVIQSEDLNRIRRVLFHWANLPLS